MCRRVERIFDSRPDSVPAARRFLAGALVDWGVVAGDPAHATSADLLLVASELVTNAAKARTHRFVLAVETHRDHVELAVTDEDPHPARRLHPDVDKFNGRGLGIVEAVADSWGQTAFDGRTKRVWCRVQVPPGSALARGCGHEVY